MDCFWFLLIFIDLGVLQDRRLGNLWAPLQTVVVPILELVLDAEVSNLDDLMICLKALLDITDSFGCSLILIDLGTLQDRRLVSVQGILDLAR